MSTARQECVREGIVLATAFLKASCFASSNSAAVYPVMEHANSSLCDIGGSGGLGGGLGGGGGIGMTDQAEGGPSVLEVPSMRRKLVSHEEASENMSDISVTLAVFHEEMSWLNEEAL